MTTAMLMLAELDYERLIGNLGIPAVFMLVLLYAMATQGPRLVAAHLDFLETVKQHGEQILALQERHTEAIDKISELMLQRGSSEGSGAAVTTHAALRRYADVVEAMLEGSRRGQLVQPHLRAVRQILAKE